jgi:hypothetical protein
VSNLPRENRIADHSCVADIARAQDVSGGVVTNADLVEAGEQGGRAPPPAPSRDGPDADTIREVVRLRTTARPEVAEDRERRGLPEAEEIRPTSGRECQELSAAGEDDLVDARVSNQLAARPTANAGEPVFQIAAHGCAHDQAPRAKFRDEQLEGMGHQQIVSKIALAKISGDADVPVVSSRVGCHARRFTMIV